jgi:hypothetical protein
MGVYKGGNEASKEWIVGREDTNCDYKVQDGL